MDSSWGRQGPSSAPGSSRTAAAGASNGKGKGKGRGGGRRKGGRGGGGGGRGRGSKKRANDGGAKTSSSGGDDTGGGDSYSTLGKLVSKATKPTRETGYKHLDEDTVRRIKAIAKTDEHCAAGAIRYLMQRMAAKSAEVRFMALAIVGQLFQRSRVVRAAVVGDLKDFMNLAVGHDARHPLPGPPAAATALRQKALALMEEWNENHGEMYKGLRAAYRLLREGKRIRFPDLQARVTRERQAAERREKHSQRLLRAKYIQAKGEIEEQAPEVETMVREMHECFAILVPTVPGADAIPTGGNYTRQRSGIPSSRDTLAGSGDGFSGRSATVGRSNNAAAGGMHGSRDGTRSALLFPRPEGGKEEGCGAASEKCDGQPEGDSGREGTGAGVIAAADGEAKLGRGVYDTGNNTSHGAGSVALGTRVDTYLSAGSGSSGSCSGSSSDGLTAGEAKTGGVERGRERRPRESKQETKGVEGGAGEEAKVEGMAPVLAAEPGGDSDEDEGMEWEDGGGEDGGRVSGSSSGEGESVRWEEGEGGDDDDSDIEGGFGGEEKRGRSFGKKRRRNGEAREGLRTIADTVEAAGLGSNGYELQVEVPMGWNLTTKGEEGDAALVVSALRERYKVLTSRLLPLLSDWIQTLSRVQFDNDSENIITNNNNSSSNNSSSRENRRGGDEGINSSHHSRTQTASSSTNANATATERRVCASLLSRCLGARNSANTVVSKFLELRVDEEDRGSGHPPAALVAVAGRGIRTKYKISNSVPGWGSSGKGGGWGSVGVSAAATATATAIAKKRPRLEIG